MFRPYIKRPRVLFVIALVNLVLVYLSYISYEFTPNKNYNIKIKSAQIMRDALDEVQQYSRNIIAQNELNYDIFETGIIGVDSTSSSMTTKYGSRDAKVATTIGPDVDLDTVDGQKRFVELNKSAVEGGYEGVMIKDPEASYECKRTHSWLKAKPFIEVTLKVVSVEEGTGRNKGRLGAILVEGKEIDEVKKKSLEIEKLVRPYLG